MTAFPTEPPCVRLGPSRSGRDINDGPVHAPDGTYACGDPDCYGCWPEGAPNTVAYTAGAVACHDEASARRHRDRATWWQPEVVVQLPHQQPLHALRSIPERRWTR